MKLAIASAIIGALSLTDAHDTNYSKLLNANNHEVRMPSYEFATPLMQEITPTIVEIKGCNAKLETAKNLFVNNYDNFIYHPMKMWAHTFSHCQLINTESSEVIDECWKRYNLLHHRIIGDYIDFVRDSLEGKSCNKTTEYKDVYVFMGDGEFFSIGNFYRYEVIL